MKQNILYQSNMRRESLEFGLKAPILDMLLIDRMTGNLYSANEGYQVPKTEDVSKLHPNDQFLAHLRNEVQRSMIKSAFEDQLVKNTKNRYIYCIQLYD